MFDRFGSQAQFYAVYILEAHPSDVWQMQSNVRDNVVFASPQNLEQREAVGSTCVRKLGIKFPALVDNFQNTVEQAYTGWPDRIYLIDTEGRIVYKSRPGPFGFKASELEQSLNNLHRLPKPSSQVVGFRRTE